MSGLQGRSPESYASRPAAHFRAAPGSRDSTWPRSGGVGGRVFQGEEGRRGNPGAGQGSDADLTFFPFDPLGVFVLASHHKEGFGFRVPGFELIKSAVSSSGCQVPKRKFRVSSFAFRVEKRFGVPRNTKLETQ